MREPRRPRQLSMLGLAIHLLRLQLRAGVLSSLRALIFTSRVRQLVWLHSLSLHNAAAIYVGLYSVFAYPDDRWTERVVSMLVGHKHRGSCRPEAPPARRYANPLSRVRAIGTTSGLALCCPRRNVHVVRHLLLYQPVSERWSASRSTSVSSRAGCGISQVDRWHDLAAVSTRIILPFATTRTNKSDCIISTYNGVHTVCTCYTYA